MPVYCYQCSRTGAQIDVVRDVDLRNETPTSDEIAAAQLVEPEGGFDWQRKILPPKVSFGERWSPDGGPLKGRH